MRFLSDTLSGVLAALGLQLEPWMAPAVALALFALFVPAIVRSRKLKRARKLLQRAAHEDYEARRRLQQQALTLVDDQPMGLVGLAEEALRRGMRPVAEEAVARLAATGKQRDYLRLLLRKLSTDRPATPEGEGAAIERLMEAGMREAARERYRAAIRRWPDDEALRELRDRVHSRS